MNVPWPYWVSHNMIAVAISLVTLEIGRRGVVIWPLAGALFYASREIRDREKFGFWDWMGMTPIPIGVTLSAALSLDMIGP